MKVRFNLLQLAYYVLVAILIAIIIRNMLFLYELSKYKYARTCNFEIEFLSAEDLYKDSLCQDEELTQVLEECIKIVNSTDLKELYPKLSWEKLDTLSIWFCPDYIQTSKIYVTFCEYNKNRNYILVTPECLQINRSLLYNRIIHEIMHALLSNVHLGQLKEGIADFYALIIAYSNNFDFKVSYREEYLFWILLCNIWGEQSCMDMVSNNTLYKNIDSITLPGFGKKLDDILYYISNSERNRTRFEREELIMMAQDIICHATRNYCDKEVDDAIQRRDILTLCRNNLIISNEYFLKILQ